MYPDEYSNCVGSTHHKCELHVLSRPHCAVTSALSLCTVAAVLRAAVYSPADVNVHYVLCFYVDATYMAATGLIETIIYVNSGSRCLFS